MKGNTIELKDIRQLFDQHYSSLCKVAYHVVSDANLAEDIVQDFFFEIWKKKSAIHLEGEFYHYACRSVKNAAISYYRDKKNYLTIVTDELPEERTDDQAYNHDIDERVKKIYAIAELMPTRRKKIFLLNNDDKLKYSDIAALLGISVNTVKTQIKLAYQFIRQYNNTN
ncbi:hypothetical protein DBR43_01280 [Pedobacter sp. KBW06]|uniref:sigma-70 family RNA polymerase sigma factor n=1 Tax=Pedobacter sp. KBW06 TaxID=2153359 RepID=UPI000F59DA83|nr:sigma-70 family RNA polymerase sigma factor [Pedobacter sp. KBW06]RQO74067.1 hypothetical protein DBR43_01280 [Pedobacter sp. KBW06]